jgi:tetratricopeptide (TPR) repeat protein
VDSLEPNRTALSSLPPRCVAGYEILGELGHGGMGVVYKARQLALNRLVALKMVRSAVVSRSEMTRFKTEASAVARLQHPNIVHIYEVGEYQGQPFFSLELLEGGSLDNQLDGRPLAAGPASRLVRTLALAIQAAHDKGIVHRDLKPANILLTAGTNLAAAGDSADSETLGIPKITDFGLAKYLHGSAVAGHTKSGAVLGTPSYMAPEQAEGHGDEVGPWTDTYALGAILYELLTGKPPFKARTVLETLEQVRSDDPVPPRRLQPKAPRDLETICLKCLAKDPKKRYASAQALAEDLRRFLAGESIHARPAGMLERVVKWAWRRPTAAGLLAVCVLGVLAVGTAIPLHIHQLRTRVAAATAKVEAKDREARRQELIADCQENLRLGEEKLNAAGRENGMLAQDRFTQVLNRLPEPLVASDEELLRLHQEAKLKLETATKRLDDADAADDADRRCREFFRLKDEAFFLLHRNLVPGSGAANLDQSARTAREALAQVGLAGASRELAPTLKFLGPRRREQLDTGLEEVTLMLAEALARPRPGDGPDAIRGRASDALAVLAWAAARGPIRTLAFHRRRTRYLWQQGGGVGPEPVVVGHGQPTTALDWFLAGRDKLVHSGNGAEAIHDFDRALDLEPDLFWAHFLCALACNQLERLADARVNLSACVRSRPNWVWSRLLRGYLRGQEGDTIGAEEDFAAALQHQPDDLARWALCLYRGALCLRHAIRDDEVLQAMRTWTLLGQSRLGLSLVPDPAAYLLGVAEKATPALGHQETLRAVKYFEEAVQLQPELYHGHSNLAEACTQMGALARAETELDKALVLAPDQADLYRQRARVRQQRHRLREALADLDKVLGLAGGGGQLAGKKAVPAPATVAADHRERAALLGRLERFPQALLACDAAVAACPEDAAAHRLRGEILLKLGCSEDALEALENYLRLTARPDVEVFRRRVQALANIGDLAGIPNEYERALKVQRDPALYAAQGWAYLVIQKLPQALADFEEALLRDRRLPEAYNGRGLVRALQGDYGAAVDDARKALSCGRDSYRVFYDAAVVFAQAAAAVSRRPPADAAVVRANYEGQAVDLLTAALDHMKAAQRRRFWRETVARDPYLVPLFHNDAFRRLEGEYAPARQ